MKTLFKSALISLGFLAGAAAPLLLADDATPPPPPPAPAHGGHAMPTPAEQLARLTSMLGLSADQQKSILVILQDQQKGMKDIFTNDSLDRDQRRQAMKDLRTATREKIRALLTPEQVAKFKEDMHGWKTHEGSSSN